MNNAVSVIVRIDAPLLKNVTSTNWNAPVYTVRLVNSDQNQESPASCIVSPYAILTKR